MTAAVLDSIPLSASPAGRVRPGHLVALFGILAAALATAMLVIAFGGTSQEYFEEIHPAAEYARALEQQADLLRVVFGLDGLFLLAYVSYFVAYVRTRRGHVDVGLLRLVLAGVLAAAVLDAIENFHILAMLHAAEAGAVPSAMEIELQYVLSATKFTLGYLAAIGLALSYPRDTALARGVAVATGVMFPIVGVLVFVVPEAWAGALAMVRVAFFASGYALSAIVLWPNERNLES